MNFMNLQHPERVPQGAKRIIERSSWAMPIASIVPPATSKPSQSEMAAIKKLVDDNEQAAREEKKRNPVGLSFTAQAFTREFKLPTK